MTIKDLSEKTGYGVATISRVLNNHPNVSEKARKVIMQAVEESGFQLNANAKQLKQQHATSILVVVKGTSNEMFSEMVETIQNQIAQAKFPLFVDYLDEDANEVLRAVQLCREKKPLGILFLGGNMQNFLKDFDKIDIPCVLVTNDGSQLPFANLSSVYTDDREAARCAMDALIAQGHRKVVIVGGDREVSDISRLRYEGCQQSFRKHNIPFDPQRDYQGVRFSCEDGYNATKALFASGDYTAIFAFSDVMAIGAIRALWEAGKRVPEDVSVMGLDGLVLGKYLVPQLSTIRQDFQTIALRSVAILLDAIEDGLSARHETVPFQVQRRESIRSISE